MPHVFSSPRGWPLAGACRPATGPGRRPGAGSTGDLGVRQDQEPFRGQPGDHRVGDLLRRSAPRRTRRHPRAGGPRRARGAASACRTPCGHSALTRMPRSPYVIASHSANATAACLVTAYGASPTAVSSPAAEQVCSRYPRRARACRAARRGPRRRATSTLTPHVRSQSSSVASRPAAGGDARRWRRTGRSGRSAPRSPRRARVPAPRR